MTAQQNSAFQRLLSAWRHREELRATRNVGEIAEARAGLESARNDVHTSLAGFR